MFRGGRGKREAAIEVLPRWRDRLFQAGYSWSALQAQLGIGFPDDVGLLNRGPTMERLRYEPTPLAALIRLFFLEAEVSARRLSAPIPAAWRKTLADMGLLRIRPAGIRARLRIDPVEDLLVLSDRRMEDPDLGALRLPRGDMVYPPSSDSLLLARAIPPLQVERALDLCTGSGIQGLLVASRAREVVAIDVGPRAVAMAASNAAFNRVGNFTARCGDLFRPVAGEKFDLLIANPPFVPAPRRGPAYHSGGPRGDRVLRRIVMGMGDHLRPGGHAFAISHLALAKGENVRERMRPWAERFPGRVLALVLESGTVIDLAAAQSMFALDEGYAAYAAEVERWCAYLRRRGLDRVVVLLMAAQRKGRRSLEVSEAFQRVFPLPLSKPPADLIADWL